MIGPTSPITRISMGLVSLSCCLLLGFEALFGIFPSEADAARQLRGRIAESMATQVAALLQSGQLPVIEKTIAAVQAGDPTILSIGLRRYDGAVVARAGDHLRHWQGHDAASANDRLVLPIRADAQRWGAVELAFRPAAERSLVQWATSGPVRLVLAFSALGGLLFYLYLRRVLQHLDPSSAVPSRVRTAFDTLTEGVLIVDARGRVVMANAGVERLRGASSDSLIGKRLSELDWLVSRLPGEPSSYPWAVAMRTKEPLRGQQIDIPQDDGTTKKVVINCAPVLDEGDAMRGCMITFDDVTALDRAHAQLLDVLADLAASKDKLESQNDKLKRLAERDPLTGCLNRRAFFETYEPLYREALQQHGELVCIMSDIDFFKRINDGHGHAVGDRAIQEVARVLTESVRDTDLVCRYGGEEFCIALPGIDIESAMRLAERLRRRVEDECGPIVFGSSDGRMTTSVGVASVRFEARDAAGLVDLADQALYAAKKSGRNRVVRFDQLPELVDEQSTGQPAKHPG